MEKTTATLTQHEEAVTSSDGALADGKRLSISLDTRQEHEWTLNYVLVHHKVLVGWTFFWALCAIGW
jgi:hypothetical protein